MTDAWDYDENDNQQNGPKALREAYKAQKDANDALMKRLEALEVDANRNRVADLFESQGVPRSAAKFYSGDPDTDKVSAFVTEMRTAFGGASPEVLTSQVQTPSTDDQLKFQNMMQAGANGDTGTNMSVLQAVIDNPNSSTKDRVAAFNEFARLNK